MHHYSNRMGNWPGISNHYYQNMCKVFLTLSEDVCVLCSVRSMWSVLGSVFEVFVCLSVTSVCVHVCARVNVYSNVYSVKQPYYMKKSKQEILNITYYNSSLFLGPYFVQQGRNIGSQTQIQQRLTRLLQRRFRSIYENRRQGHSDGEETLWSTDGCVCGSVRFVVNLGAE